MSLKLDETCAVGNLFIARRTHLRLGLTTHKSIFFIVFFVPGYSGKIEPHCQATTVEFGSPHEAICSGFVDVCLQILNSYEL
jgi:hypothetical protein